jgi:bloom syndrome protein
LRREFSGLPIMALTATATPTVKADIRRTLGFGHAAKDFTQTVNRPNLFWEVGPAPRSA